MKTEVKEPLYLKEHVKRVFEAEDIVAEYQKHCR